MIAPTRLPPDDGVHPRRSITSPYVLCALLLTAIVFRIPLVSMLSAGALGTGVTLFVAVCVQALPFLVLGALLNGLIAASVSSSAIRALLPSPDSATAPATGLASPGGERASVPRAEGLQHNGVATLAFLLTTPVVNPLVFVSTAVAFPGEPRMVLARFLGSLLTACVLGYLLLRAGNAAWIAERALRSVEQGDSGSRWTRFIEKTRHDLVQAGGFLILGGLTAAMVRVMVPAEWMRSLGGQPLLSVFVMALLAVLLALYGQADAFVAAAFVGLPLIGKLVFLVVGPAVNLRSIVSQARALGRGFAARFAPAAFMVATGCAVLVGTPLLGAG